ncbi:MAG TPA: CU044_5270 family protein, partial [Actinoallomurus sp.]|nr:CU044_5270 family protein [Actinoallomurus sp.]
MNAIPTQSGSSDRDELARLLPEPVERDLPNGRHQRLQEFVMSQIQQDLRPASPAPRRSKRPVFLAGALVGAAAATTAVVISAGGSGGSGPVTTPASPLSARQVLLAAATTAERKPAGSGTYWYVKTVTSGGKDRWETWTRHDGRTWSRGNRTGDRMMKVFRPVPFRLGVLEVSFERLQRLPTEPDALMASIATSIKHSDVRTMGDRPDAAMRKRLVFGGLVSLVSQLPAPPKVRAAAFRAIASYPDVKNLGPVDGGQGLQFPISTIGPPAATVLPPAPEVDDQAKRARDQALKARAEARVKAKVSGGK